MVDWASMECLLALVRLLLWQSIIDKHRIMLLWTLPVPRRVRACLGPRFSFFQLFHRIPNQTFPISPRHHWGDRAREIAAWDKHDIIDNGFYAYLNKQWQLWEKKTQWIFVRCECVYLLRRMDLCYRCHIACT